MSEQTIARHISLLALIGPRIVRYLAWAAWIFNILLLATAITLMALARASLFQILDSGSMLIAFSTFSTVGLLIVLQRPENTVGWLFLTVGIGTGTTAFSAAYSLYPKFPLSFPIALLGDIV